MKKLQYACCFCGEGIGDSAERFHRLDPCAVVLIGNWQQPEAEQAEQQFFCHLSCFKKAVEGKSPVEIEELAPSAHLSDAAFNAESCLTHIPNDLKY